MTPPTAQDTSAGELPLQQLDRVVIRFAGDSGDGMQVTGNQFTRTSALFGNDLATLPDFPAEIRAPVGTRPGVSGFQLQFSSSDIHTPGDQPDVLVAMNPAALMVNIGTLKTGGIVIVNNDAFKSTDLKKAKCETNPLEDGSLDGFRVIEVGINSRVSEALADSPLSNKDKQRCKNFYTLGLMYWVYSRPLEPTLEWLEEKFKGKDDLIAANQTALRAGYNAGDIRELFQGQYEVPKATLQPGTYRNVMGNQALAIGLVAGARLAGLKPVYCSYPITPASSVLEFLAGYKNHGVVTIQSEDEIAAICSAIGASFAGTLGMTGTSGPGMALKGEAMGLAISTELPLVIVDVQRAGPSTGMPTKVEQSDLLSSIFGRNGDAPMPVVAISKPSDAFELSIEACRIAVQYMTPVILLSDNFIANGAEPWALPDLESLEPFPVQFTTEKTEDFQSFGRDEKLARPWVKPGTEGMEFRIGGLEKAPSSNISYDPDNHQAMTDIRHQKVRNVADSIPTPEVHGADSGDLLVLGWGSTVGILRQAVENARANGQSVSRIHLTHVWPLPHGLDEIFARFKAILIPEMNVAQMTYLLRGELPDHNYIPFNKVTGQPFLVTEVEAEIKRVLDEHAGA
ncbi:MAG: 2-oxoacid:acceptor oxidoreductase subunit alpha [Planctomycetota bacterium]|nr:2-oxoacid:acceptor oxidoreductase subunit alpha [Planctomycetota bacterium]MDG1986196.1 2-oxoacid:acceptor oxidoreductase subunit alpha [Planctomycetota bacterium]